MPTSHSSGNEPQGWPALVGGGLLNVAPRLSAGKDGAFLRSLLDLLLLVRSAAKIVDAHDEYNQKRQRNGKLKQR